MDFGPMLYLRAERIDRLHRLVVIRVRGPVQLLFRAEAPNEAGVPLDAVVHDGGPLGDVSSVGLDAFPFGYVAPPRRRRTCCLRSPRRTQSRPGCAKRPSA